MCAKLNSILLFAASLLAALAVLTLLPYGAKINDLGYRSLCPFAPWSTLALLAVAGLAMLIRQYLREMEKREATSRSSSTSESAR